MTRWPAVLVAVLRLGLRSAPAHLCGLAVLTGVAAATPVVAAGLTKAVLDRLAAQAPFWPDIAAVTGGLGAVGLTAAVLPHLAEYLEAEFGRRTSLAAQDDLYRAVNGFAGLARFEDPVVLDRIRVAQQCGLDTPGQVLANGLTVARTIATIGGFTAALLMIGWGMAAIVLAGAVPVVVSQLRLARARVRNTLQTTPIERRELFYADLLGDVQAAKEVRLFGIGDHLRTLMRRHRTAINVMKRDLDRRTTVVQGILGTIAAGIAAGGLLWTASRAARGELSIGDVSMFAAAVAAVQSSVNAFAFGVAVCGQHLLVFRHYLDVVRARPDLSPADPERTLPTPVTGIDVRDVWFRYSPEHPWVLRGVSFTIPCERSVALVGANGSGKSTLVKLLCRFYDPERGSIRWDGVDIRNVPVDVLRSRISAIFQDFMEYDMTAAENIALGDLAAGSVRTAIEAAAAGAQVHEALAGLPRGYDTMLSRSFGCPDGDASDADSPGDGVVLSGGQWQRVALARTLLRDRRDLLILDEPSSGLDAEGEYRMHAHLREHRGRGTSLLISHRLNAVRAADTIVVLDRGVVAEQGSHGELMAAGGRYARSFTLQARGYTDADHLVAADGVLQ